MPNVISSRTYRDKYRTTTLAQALRKRLVSEEIFQVDRTENLRINSPYGSTPTTVVQAMTGTYTPVDFTTTDDTLTVTDEFIVSEHIRDFENLLSNFDLFVERVDIMTYNVALKVDQWVLNCAVQSATGTYTTAAGAFGSTNVNVIFSSLIGLVSGYADMYKGLFLVIENTEVAGVIQAQAANGFSYADAALRNGFVSNIMGVDIYVVRTGTFVSATIGTKTFVNSGKRLFGVKKVATYAAPRGVQHEEKGVSGKTGKEVVVYGYIGFKAWFNITDLLVAITVTA